MQRVAAACCCCLSRCRCVRHMPLRTTPSLSAVKSTNHISSLQPTLKCSFSALSRLMHHALDVHNKHRNKNAKPSKGGLTLTHQCAEKYKAKVFPRMISSPQTLPDLLKNSFPISSDSGFGRHGKSLPSGSSPTIDRPSVVMTPPLGSKITRDGIPRTLNLVLNDDFLSLDTKGNKHRGVDFGLILGYRYSRQQILFSCFGKGRAPARNRAGQVLFGRHIRALYRSRLYRLLYTATRQQHVQQQHVPCRVGGVHFGCGL